MSQPSATQPTPPADVRRGAHDPGGLGRHRRRARSGIDASSPPGIALRAAGATPSERYPTIAIERYAGWTREDGSPFDPARVFQAHETHLGTRYVNTRTGIPFSRALSTVSCVPPLALTWNASSSSATSTTSWFRR